MNAFPPSNPRTLCWSAGSKTTFVRVCQNYGMGVITWSPLAGGWLSGNFGTGKQNTSRRAERLPARYDMEDPTNKVKLQAVDQLTELAAKTGHSLPELAVAFVLNHPGVASGRSSALHDGTIDRRHGCR